jgi:hypothetical protein
VTTLAEQLLDATPPPPADVDPDTLLAVFAKMMTDRQRILDAIDAAGPTAQGADPEVSRGLRARHEAWQAVLAAARDLIGAARAGVVKLRRYAPPTP